MTLSATEINRLQQGVTEFALEMQRLAPAHYKLSAEQLINNLDSRLGRLQYARLVGVVVKEPFAEAFNHFERLGSQA
jgi:hypothetical protein